MTNPPAEDDAAAPHNAASGLGDQSKGDLRQHGRKNLAFFGLWVVNLVIVYSWAFSAGNFPADYSFFSMIAINDGSVISPIPWLLTYCHLLLFLAVCNGMILSWVFMNNLLNKERIQRFYTIIAAVSSSLLLITSVGYFLNGFIFVGIVVLLLSVGAALWFFRRYKSSSFRFGFELLHISANSLFTKLELHIWSIVFSVIQGLHLAMWTSAMLRVLHFPRAEATVVLTLLLVEARWSCLFYRSLLFVPSIRYMLETITTNPAAVQYEEVFRLPLRKVPTRRRTRHRNSFASHTNRVRGEQSTVHHFGEDEPAHIPPFFVESEDSDIEDSSDDEDMSPTTNGFSTGFAAAPVSGRPALSSNPRFLRVHAAGHRHGVLRGELAVGYLGTSDSDSEEDDSTEEIYFPDASPMPTPNLEPREAPDTLVAASFGIPVTSADGAASGPRNRNGTESGTPTQADDVDIELRALIVELGGEDTDAAASGNASTAPGLRKTAAPGTGAPTPTGAGAHLSSSGRVSFADDLGQTPGQATSTTGTATGGPALELLPLPRGRYAMLHFLLPKVGTLLGGAAFSLVTPCLWPLLRLLVPLETSTNPRISRTSLRLARHIRALLRTSHKYNYALVSFYNIGWFESVRYTWQLLQGKGRHKAWGEALLIEDVTDRLIMLLKYASAAFLMIVSIVFMPSNYYSALSPFARFIFTLTTGWVGWYTTALPLSLVEGGTACSFLVFSISPPFFTRFFPLLGYRWARLSEELAVVRRNKQWYTPADPFSSSTA